MDLENLNLLINHEYQRTFYTSSLVRQGDFLNLQTKCMDSKPNVNYDLLYLLQILVHGERIVFFIFDGVMYTYTYKKTIWDKDLIFENNILKVKLEEADGENTFLRGEVEDVTILLNAKIKPLLIILKCIPKSACY